MYLLEVYVTNASLNIDHPFTYGSNIEVSPYVRVSVSFHHADTTALVTSCTYTEKTKEEYEKENGYTLQFIERVIDEEAVISREQFDLALWMAKTTLSPFISCLNAMLPKTLKTSKKTVKAKTIEKIRIIGKGEGLTKRQGEIFAQLYDGMEASEARKLSVSIIRRLIDSGTISIYEEEAEYRETFSESTAFKQLTDDQQRVFEEILHTDKTVSLLYGITGSGKTEVYLHLAREYLKQGKEVLILVPEISLTPQMIQRVKERFQEVVFYHSELSDQERYEQYQRIKKGSAKIVVGTRSSIFLPFHDLGIIIIDEEHDSSYKQDNVPCYHVKNVAVKRAIDHHAKVLLASATPSLDSYSRALKGDYHYCVLDKRINLKLPHIDIVDLSREVRKNNDYILSKSLKEAIQETLDNRKQAIILLNRRGYSPVIKCSSCNTTLMCQDCDIPLSYHKDLNLLKCHQCSRTYRVPKVCPNCHEESLIYYGFGTKRVEETLHQAFPHASIERMDRDNVSRKGAHSLILKRFEKHEIDILIGTQMIAKGLDYPDVTLVGILNADAGLMHQDYNSAKMTFDLLMQASGRSGRAGTEGRVIIQAFNPDHYVLRSVLSQDYAYFFNIEMNYRRKSNYPPYAHIIEIMCEDTNTQRLSASVNYLYEQIKELPYKVYRPYELPKLKKYERVRILLMDKDLVSMINSVHRILDAYLKQRNMSKIKIDIDPLYLE